MKGVTTMYKYLGYRIFWNTGAAAFEILPPAKNKPIGYANTIEAARLLIAEHVGKGNEQ